MVVAKLKMESEMNNERIQNTVEGCLSKRASLLAPDEPVKTSRDANLPTSPPHLSFDFALTSISPNTTNLLICEKLHEEGILHPQAPLSRRGNVCCLSTDSTRATPAMAVSFDRVCGLKRFV